LLDVFLFLVTPASFFYQVPPHVLQHVELNKLLLDNNKLSSLPEDIQLMTSLEVNHFLVLFYHRFEHA
jgi:hypothetical protein